MIMGHLQASNHINKTKPRRVVPALILKKKYGSFSWWFSYNNKLNTKGVNFAKMQDNEKTALVASSIVAYNNFKE